MNMRKKACTLAHKISTRNIFSSKYKRGSFLAAWKIIKLKKYICDKCNKLSKDFNRTDNEKKTNLISIQDYIEKLYLITSKYHILDTVQEKCLLDIKYDISTMIFNNDYSNYNNYLKKVSVKLILMCSNF